MLALAHVMGRHGICHPVVKVSISQLSLLNILVMYMIIVLAAKIIIVGALVDLKMVPHAVLFLLRCQYTLCFLFLGWSRTWGEEHFGNGYEI